MLKYSDLTIEQKKFITNGCGGKGGLINPPEFIFHDSCNQHDFYYWRGCSEDDRKTADSAFYKFMKIAISNVKWYLKPHYHIWGWTYYQGVRISGKKFFHFADSMKTIEDLIKEMEKNT